MASYHRNLDTLMVYIPTSESINSITHYKIHVEVGTTMWTVSHRYNDFVDLHETLVYNHGLQRDLLPPKRLMGNHSADFIEIRRSKLQEYIQEVLDRLLPPWPRSFLVFLDFHKYEVLCVLQEMASYYHREADTLLSKTTAYSFNTLELHAISERLKMESQSIESVDRKYTFSNVLDFSANLSSVTIRGGFHQVGTSNIIYNNLPFDLLAFPCLNHLVFVNVSLNLVQDLGLSRKGCNTLTVYNSHLKCISDVLLCDLFHRDYKHTNKMHMWPRLTRADFSWNEINGFTEHLKLVPNVQYLTMDGNEIESLDNIQYLPKLTYLSLSSNFLSLKSCLRDKLPKITTLILSQNKITVLHPFAKLTSLKKLDLGSNLVEDLKEVERISKLNLECLTLNGNPISTNIDYRVTVFAYFGERAANLCLDCETPSQKELDKVALFKALRLSKITQVKKNCGDRNKK